MAQENLIIFTPADLDAYIARRVREAWPMLAESATYWKEAHDRMLADFQEMSASLNADYEGRRTGINPRHKHERV